MPSNPYLKLYPFAILLVTKLSYAGFDIKPLDQSTLTQLISGKTLAPNYAFLIHDYGTGFQNNQASMFFHKDGVIYSNFDPKLDDRVSTMTGQWSVDKQGKYCETWSQVIGDPVKHCGYWYPTDNVYLVISDKSQVIMLIAKDNIKHEFHLFD